MKVLVTGGAGFIGSHLVDLLLSRGHAVRVLDTLSPQIHGGRTDPPEYLSPEAEFRLGDVRNPDDVTYALEGVDAVFHLAASVGVGQSMYEIASYTGVNTLGTAVLLEALTKHPVCRLVTASSMSVYGEGLYRRPDGRLVSGVGRSRDRLARGEWELADSDGAPLEPVPTPESKEPSLESIYALSKYDQERMTLIVAKAYGISAAALRFFNVYGTRQALSNPYTGVLAIFAARLLNRRGPILFEDGGQKRDFVSVRDIASACLLALERDEADGGVFNIGSGRAYTVAGIARAAAEALGVHIEPVVSGRYRAGDIRHCFAEISLARKVLGYEPRVRLEDGLGELAEWLETQIAVDAVEDAHAELERRGLSL